MSAYIVFADEAWTHDPEHRFWRFYGGAMIRAADREPIETELRALKAKLGLLGEMKWSKTRPFNWERFAILVERFLDFVETGGVKFRYMWLDQLFQNPDALNDYQREYGYFILYYYFIVYCFGLPWHDDPEPVTIEFFPDSLPEEPTKRASFRDFLLRCHAARRFQNQSAFSFINVGDVNSKEHTVLQCVDVIIGAFGFRLNGLHRATQANGRRAEGKSQGSPLQTCGAAAWRD